MMTSKTFVVSSFKADTNKSEIFWEGKRFISYGHLLCLDNEDRFIVYFLDNHVDKPKPTFLPEYNLGAIFVKRNQMNEYLKLMEVNGTVYVYMNKNYPELNGVTVDEPLKELMY